MILITDTDDAYLVLPASHSHIAGNYYFKNHLIDYSKGNPNPNGPILIVWNTLKTVVSSSPEAETEGTSLETYRDRKSVV